jgi:hypothetical protein
MLAVIAICVLLVVDGLQLIDAAAQSEGKSRCRIDL